MGEGVLRDVWARMTALRPRPFEAAFEGVFGDAPDVLYGRFVAELARDALALEDERPGPPPHRAHPAGQPRGPR